MVTTCALRPTVMLVPLVAPMVMVPARSMTPASKVPGMVTTCPLRPTVMLVAFVLPMLKLAALARSMAPELKSMFAFPPTAKPRTLAELR
jgi:hypothetical protein